MLGTTIGERSLSEIEYLIKDDGYDLRFETDDNHLTIEVTWADGQAGVLVNCCGSVGYWGYASLQELQRQQPCWRLSHFTIVERTRDDEDV